MHSFKSGHGFQYTLFEAVDHNSSLQRLTTVLGLLQMKTIGSTLRKFIAFFSLFSQFIPFTSNALVFTLNFIRIQISSPNYDLLLELCFFPLICAYGLNILNIFCRMYTSSHFKFSYSTTYAVESKIRDQ